MGTDICFLLSILCEGLIIKCALKVDKTILPEDCTEYYMEVKNREYLHSLLPEHVKSCGPIVDIEEIFEIHGV